MFKARKDPRAKKAHHSLKSISPWVSLCHDTKCDIELLRFLIPPRSHGGREASRIAHKALAVVPDGPWS